MVRRATMPQQSPVVGPVVVVQRHLGTGDVRIGINE